MKEFNDFRDVLRGDDIDAIHNATPDHWHVPITIAAARAETDKPSLIVVKTTIGFGAPNKAGSCAAHGAPLGADEVAATKAALGWDAEPFAIPDAARG